MAETGLASVAAETDESESLRALKILTYLPTFREAVAQRLYDITHIWSLTLVESCPVCAEALCQVKTIF